DGGTVELTIPAGVEDGQVLRLKGKGGPGANGGGPGAAPIEIRALPPPRPLPVTLAEAVRGGRVTVPTLHGPVAMTVRKHSSGGTTLRLKGKGLPRSDGGGAGAQYVRLEIALPPRADAELE